MMKTIQRHWAYKTHDDDKQNTSAQHNTEKDEQHRLNILIVAGY
jgi:hypothetical protein